MLQDEIRMLLAPVIEELGYTLWGCVYLAQGKHSILRIYIDHEDGIGLEDCEKVSRQVSSVLDVEDPIPGNYSLEVSSPGIPRPIFYDWQYALYVGQEIAIKLYKPVAGSRQVIGIIESVQDGTLTLKAGEEQQEFLLSNIVKANLTV